MKWKGPSTSTAQLYCGMKMSREYPVFTGERGREGEQRGREGGERESKEEEGRERAGEKGGWANEETNRQSE
jgi:hypothetical protein